MLNNKNILVTGAGQGIGQGIALALADAGASVGLIDLNAESLKKTAEEIRRTGQQTLELVANVAAVPAMTAAIEMFVDRFGRLDGLVNNAGVIEMKPAIEISRDAWDWQFEVNVWGLMNCCQLAAKRMIAQGSGGAIVNIASNAGKVGYGNMSAYNATKAAVINLTRSLSMEWSEQGINVNAVCPGGVNTPMLKKAAKWVAARIGADADDLYGSMKPSLMTRHIEPLEVGRVVAFLLSDDAAIIRGQSINIDGGDTPY